ncbi:XdhC family protein [Pedococcus aerophilus]|uniref:XdhC family protein n=1 Tax=Pedococcus aerophilus TaxID=436356 RepID=UPI0031D5F6B7
MDGSPHLLLVGDGPVVEALEALCVPLGWITTVSSEQVAVDPAFDAVVVTSHHEGVDGPVLRDALAAGTAYVGAMGSRKTQARRREWLLAHDVSEEALATLHAPIGLDIGAQAPGEIAVAVLAEVVSVWRGAAAAVTSVSDRGGAIHPDLAPGEAYCPGG